MQYPRLDDMPVKALISLAQQKNNQIFNEYIENVIKVKLLKEEKNISEMIYEFFNAFGLMRKIWGEVISLKLVDTFYVIDIEFIDILFNELEVDYLWILANEAVIPIVQKKAFDRVMLLLDEYDNDINIGDLYQEKYDADKLVLNLERGGF